MSLYMVPWNSCGLNGRGGEIPYRNPEKEPHLDLEVEADFMEGIRKEESLVKRRLL